ncbi:putative Rz/Rzl spanin protein [Escherichia phage vB_EcoS_Uz-1]|nr:putative Rz/Rzl spanin protein [Escherichia phage vB_EcoS_Uz-1]
MQQSERRASVYKRQAEAGTLECRSLASHAARLDNSLEEGRRLVEELRATVRLRDNQLIELGKQIQADRKLFEQE